MANYPQQWYRNHLVEGNLGVNRVNILRNLSAANIDKTKAGDNDTTNTLGVWVHHHLFSAVFKEQFIFPDLLFAYLEDKVYLIWDLLVQK